MENSGQVNCYCCNKEISTTPIKNKKGGWRHKKRTAYRHHVVPLQYCRYESECVYLCSKCHSAIHKKISEEAIKKIYSENENFFYECLEMIKDDNKCQKI